MKPVKNRKVIWRKDGPEDEIIVAYKWNWSTQEILNPTAARIFELCDGKHTVEQIANIISEEFRAQKLVKVHLNRILQERPVRVSEGCWVKKDNVVGVTDPYSGKLYWLNETASFIWELCDGKYVVNDIIDHLMKEYRIIKKETATKDVIHLLMLLRELKLIELK